MNQPADNSSLRQARRPSLRTRHRGRLLRQHRGAPPSRRAVRGPRPASLPRVRPRPGLPGRVGGGLADALGGPPALPELRVERGRTSSTRRPSTASTSSSTAAPSTSCKRPQAPGPGQHGGGGRALRQGARVRRHLADGLLDAPAAPRANGRFRARRLAYGRRRRRPPAPAPRAGRPVGPAAPPSPPRRSSACARASSSTPRRGDRVADRLGLPRACAPRAGRAARARRRARARGSAAA